MKDAFAPTLISMAEAHLRGTFSEEAEKEAQKAVVPENIKTRKDLRNIPFVTIDGADAKDFDDAVWAEKDESGWHVMVGIAGLSMARVVGMSGMLTPMRTVTTSSS